MAKNFTTVSEQSKKLLAKGNNEKAIKLWEGFLENANENEAANALNNLGDICTRIKDNVKAIDHYLKASHAFEKAGFPLKAIAALKKIVKMDPERAEVFLRLGDLNARRDMVGNAVEAYLKVAKLMTKQGDKPSALAMIKKICILDPVNTRHRLQLAAELFELGFTEQAMEETINAVDLFLMKGNLEEAERYCRHLLDLSPGNPAAQQRLERIANWGGVGHHSGEPSIEDLFAELDGTPAPGGAPAQEAAPADPAMDPFAESSPAADPFAEAAPEPAPAMDPFAEAAPPAPEPPAGAAPAMDPFAESAPPAPEPPAGGSLELDGMLEGSAPPAPEPPAGGSLELDGMLQGNVEAAPEPPAGGGLELDGMVQDNAEAAPEPPADDSMSISLDGMDMSGSAPEEPAAEVSDPSMEINIDVAGTQEIEMPAVEEPAPDEPAASPAIDMGDMFSAAATEPPVAESPAEEMPVAETPMDMAPGAEAPPVDVTPEAPAPAADEGEAIDIEATLGEAAFYENQGLKDEARALYEKVLAVDPKHENAQVRMKALEEYDTEQNFVDGVADEFTVFDDFNAEIQDTIDTGDNEDWRKVSEDADVNDIVAAFRKGVQQSVDEDDSDTHYDLGVAYHEMGLLEEAVEELQLAIKGTSRYADSCVALARCFTDLGKPSLAIGQLRAAVQQSDPSGDEWVALAYELGIVLEASGEEEEARKMFEDVYARDITFRDVGEKLAG